MMYQYDAGFYDYINLGSRRSAAHVVALVASELKPRSVLDVGCGSGAWLAEWLTHSGIDVYGVDGDYVDRDHLLVPQDRFGAQDISTRFDLKRRFDLVQSLEVAEHIPSAHADELVDNLVAHGDIVMFSAAVPGQGGEHHVNEQPYEYWREKFRRRGYRAFDYLRPRVAAIQNIEPWYRYNTLFYVHTSAVTGLPPAVAASELRDEDAVPDIAPLTWRVRNRCLAALPAWGIDALAKLKHRVVRLLGTRT